MGFLRYDSDFMVMLGRIADYVILNVLCVIFSIPLFTVGAAVTAKYYVAMKLARKEEPNVFKAFINSFRDNFKQATLLWLLSVFLSAFLAIESIKFFRNLIYLDLLRGQEQVSGRRDIQCHYKKRNSFYRIKAFWIM